MWPKVYVPKNTTNQDFSPRLKFLTLHHKSKRTNYTLFTCDPLFWIIGSVGYNAALNKPLTIKNCSFFVEELFDYYSLLFKSCLHKSRVKNLLLSKTNGLIAYCRLNCYVVIYSFSTVYFFIRRICLKGKGKHYNTNCSKTFYFYHLRLPFIWK